MKHTKVRAGRAAVTLSVVLTAVVSTVVDVLPGEDGHMGNSQWPPHALFHDAAMFCTLLAMMCIFLWLLLRKSREPQVGMLAATLFPFGFWSGFFYITTLFPQASLLTATVRDASGRFVPLNAGNIAQWPEHVRAATPVVLGVPIYINVAIGVVLMAMAAWGLWRYRRGLRDGEVDPKLIP
jgi:hypothetical protein